MGRCAGCRRRARRSCRGRHVRRPFPISYFASIGGASVPQLHFRPEHSAAEQPTIDLLACARLVCSQVSFPCRHPPIGVPQHLSQLLGATLVSLECATDASDAGDALRRSFGGDGRLQHSWAQSRRKARRVSAGRGCGMHPGFEEAVLHPVAALGTVWESFQKYSGMLVVLSASMPRSWMCACSALVPLSLRG